MPTIAELKEQIKAIAPKQAVSNKNKTELTAILEGLKAKKIYEAAAPKAAPKVREPFPSPTHTDAFGKSFTLKTVPGVIMDLKVGDKITLGAGGVFEGKVTRVIDRGVTFEINSSEKAQYSADLGWLKYPGLPVVKINGKTKEEAAAEDKAEEDDYAAMVARFAAAKAAPAPPPPKAPAMPVRDTDAERTRAAKAGEERGAKALAQLRGVEGEFRDRAKGAKQEAKREAAEAELSKARSAVVSAQNAHNLAKELVTQTRSALIDAERGVEYAEQELLRIKYGTDDDSKLEELTSAVDQAIAMAERGETGAAVTAFYNSMVRPKVTAYANAIGGDAEELNDEQFEKVQEAFDAAKKKAAPAAAAPAAAAAAAAAAPKAAPSGIPAYIKNIKVGDTIVYGKSGGYMGDGGDSRDAAGYQVNGKVLKVLPRNQFEVSPRYTGNDPEIFGLNTDRNWLKAKGGYYEVFSINGLTRAKAVPREAEEAAAEAAMKKKAEKSAEKAAKKAEEGITEKSSRADIIAAINVLLKPKGKRIAEGTAAKKPMLLDYYKKLAAGGS
jgi:hypothetical protein